MYNESERRLFDQFKVLASIMGAEFKENEEEEVREQPKQKPKPSRKMNFQFRAPGDYNHLSQTEKEELTRKMMTHWKSWESRSELVRAGEY